MKTTLEDHANDPANLTEVDKAPTCGEPHEKKQEVKNLTFRNIICWHVGQNWQVGLVTNLAKVAKLPRFSIMSRLPNCQPVSSLLTSLFLRSPSSSTCPPGRSSFLTPSILDLIKTMIKISSKNLIITILIRTCKSDSSPRKTPRAMTSLLLLQGVLGYVGIESLLLLLLSLFLSFRHGCWYHIIVVVVILVVVD